jgi:hypothetical protein
MGQLNKKESQNNSKTIFNLKSTRINNNNFLIDQYKFNKNRTHKKLNSFIK